MRRVVRAAGADIATAGSRTVVLGRRGAVDVRKLAPGAVIVSESPATAADWFAIEHGLAQAAAQRHVAAVLQMYRVDCVLDVGANRGQFGTALRAAGYDGRIVSFEPVPDAFAALAEEARDDASWIVRAHALGREDGTLAMNVVHGTLSSPLAATEFGARRYGRLREPETVDVPVRRLDGVLEEVTGERIYLKLDTQGYDLEVFAGLGGRTERIVALQAELPLVPIYEGMTRLPEGLGTFEAAGFEVTAMYPVSRERTSARVLEFDCVMVRRAALGG